jgi:hypothetical protein
LGEEIVADQDDGAGAELGVKGRFAAAEGGAVDGVVVDEGGGVKEFDAGGGGDEAVEVEFVVVGATGEEEEERAEPFAAGPDDVAEEIGDDGVADLSGLGNARVDPIEIGAHRPEHVRALEGHAPYPG